MHCGFFSPLCIVICPFTLWGVFSSSYLHHVQCVISSVWHLLCRWILPLTLLPAGHSQSAASWSYRSRFLAPSANQKAFSVIVHAMFSLTSTNRPVLFGSRALCPRCLCNSYHATVSRSDALALEPLLKLRGWCIAFMWSSFIPLISFLLGINTSYFYHSILIL